MFLHFLAAPRPNLNCPMTLLAAGLLILTAGCSMVSNLRPLPAAQQVERGEALLQNGQPDKADAEFQKALKAASADYRVAVYITDKCATNREWSLAQRYGELALKQTPATEKSARLLIYSHLATAYLATGDAGRALEFARTGFKEDPADPTAMNLLGYTYADAQVVDKLPEALELTRKAVRTAAQEGRSEEEVALYLDSLGWVEYQLGRVDEAIDDLTRASYSLPRVPEVLYHLGKAYMKRSRYADALPVLTRAARLEPRDRRIEETLKECSSKASPAPAEPAAPGASARPGTAILPTPHP